jgi:hypothetical protein
MKAGVCWCRCLKDFVQVGKGGASTNSRSENVFHKGSQAAVLRVI